MRTIKYLDNSWVRWTDGVVSYNLTVNIRPNKIPEVDYWMTVFEETEHEESFKIVPVHDLMVHSAKTLGGPICVYIDDGKKEILKPKLAAFYGFGANKDGWLTPLRPNPGEYRTDITDIEYKWVIFGDFEEEGHPQVFHIEEKDFEIEFNCIEGFYDLYHKLKKQWKELKKKKQKAKK